MPTTLDAVSNTQFAAQAAPKDSLSTLMFSVMSERSEILDKNIRTQIQQTQYNNERLKELNTAMSAVNAMGESGGNLGSSTMQALNTSANPPVVESMSVQAFLNMRGVTTPNSDGDNNYSKEEIGIVVSNIKNSIDSLTSTSQLDMTQLQSNMTKYNQVFDSLSNMLSKLAQSLQTIIGNLRG